MIFRSSLLLSALFLASVHAETEEQAPLPACPRMPQSLQDKYHDVDKCNHKWQTSELLREQRSERHDYFARTGQYPLIAPQKTIVCPLEPADLTPPSGIIGQDTRWIVENKSSGPVVIIFYDSVDQVERSAMHGHIVPPQNDPDTILFPGQYKVVNTFEGHVFYVRELLEDGSTGEILLQHRPGVVEFKNRFGRELNCGAATQDENAAHHYENDKEEPSQQNEATAAAMSTSTTTSSTDANSQSPLTTSADEEGTPVSRSTETTDELISPEQTTDETAPLPVQTPKHPNHCNIVYQGFRNTLGNCPLDVYYVGSEQGVTNGPMQCNEKYTFHLGTQASSNAIDEEAQLKFEVSYMGHSFVARLASNPDVVVDSFTLQPTEIHDCPSRKKQGVVVDQVIEFNGVQHGNANLQNATANDMGVVNAVVSRNAVCRAK
jgi:hypothetical protein